jgi:hypothetical protein
MRRGQSLASNTDSDTANNTSFDYKCERSATYQVQINFGEGNEGCAAVVLSLILQDSLTYIEPGKPLKSDSAETLFLWVKNELQIATDLGYDFEVEASVSQGEILQEGRFFNIIPAYPGELYVYAKVYNRKRELAESDTILYFVEKPPLPEIVLPSESAQSISLRNFRGRNSVRLSSYQEDSEKVYQLKQFGISGSTNGINELVSFDQKLTYQQVDFIRTLTPGDSFYIINAHFEAPDGNTYTGITKQIFIME